MKLFYLVILFIGCTLFAGAQTGKLPDSPSQPAVMDIKVVKFYPNPATSEINFEFLKQVDKNYTLQIYNFIGKKVFEITNASQKNTIPLTDFYRGVYIFQLRDKAGRVVESGKFQIAK
jgi:hypothetical protein